ncbi:hypothetical protein ZWY2020_041305, partial [Hordeum vulgare]
MAGGANLHATGHLHGDGAPSPSRLARLASPLHGLVSPPHGVSAATPGTPLQPTISMFREFFYLNHQTKCVDGPSLELGGVTIQRRHETGFPAAALPSHPKEQTPDRPSKGRTGGGGASV